MKSLAIIGLLALFLLNVGAVLMESAWPVKYTQGFFFEVTIRAASDMPYWLCANLALMLINGIALIQDSSIRFNSDGKGAFKGKIPFISQIILGYNLVAIPSLILLPRFYNFS